MKKIHQALIVSANYKELDIACRAVLGIDPQLFSASIEVMNTGEALFYLQDKDIDLIFISHGFGVDGVTLLQEARKRHPEIRYVFINAVDDNKFRDAFLAEFGDRGIYFVKGDPAFVPVLLRFEIEKLFYLP